MSKTNGWDVTTLRIMNNEIEKGNEKSKGDADSFLLSPLVLRCLSWPPRLAKGVLKSHAFSHLSLPMARPEWSAASDRLAQVCQSGFRFHSIYALGPVRRHGHRPW